MRTQATARAELDLAWRSRAEDPEFQALCLSDEEAEKLVEQAAALVANYFELEDPDSVRAVGVEVGMEADLGGARLRGIIDRLDLNDDGDLVVVDYKTGRAPSARYEQSRLTGVHLYALLCKALLGRTPVEVRLLHLRDPLVLTAAPSEQSVRGQERRTAAVWQAIERSCDRVDFRPRPGPLCRFCNFQSFCPEFGGSPPEPTP